MISIRSLSIILLASLLVFPWSVARADTTEYEYQYTYYNTNDMSYQILECDPSVTILDSHVESGTWTVTFSPEVNNGQYQSWFSSPPTTTYYYRLIIKILAPPYSNSAYFKVRIIDKVTLNYADDRRPINPYRWNGENGDYAIMGVLYIDGSQHYQGESRDVDFGLGWHCAFVIPENPLGSLGSISAMASALVLSMLFVKKRLG